MPMRFDDIGDRLKAFRMASGLNADEIAARIGISRAALYRYEKGEVAKIDTLERFADLLEVSVPTLLGVGVEYVSSAVAFFERMRQIEETVEHIIVLFGPVSYLLTSDSYDSILEQVLVESIPDSLENHDRAVVEVGEIMAILKDRKATYRRRQPSIVSLIAETELDRFLRNGLVGRADLPARTRRRRRQLAAQEVERAVQIMEEEPIGVQIGIVRDTLPHASFQIFRQPDRPVLAVSPFRLGEQPNVRVGVAMITSAPEAITLHEATAEDLWSRALKGREAAAFARSVIKKNAG
ncbi:MAG: helix-turn-helix transcriptional regulator [Rhodospirillaceae bacterium]|nr:helix-turn-helix transcriptional regulator [Rhodospirillaceae bacterium]MBT5459676.1 helix-turn-helix transcriptional regulator [Rhodospirillaceae bacterium]